jgi:hypothetical protein
MSQWTSQLIIEAYNAGVSVEEFMEAQEIIRKQEFEYYHDIVEAEIEELEQGAE